LYVRPSKKQIVRSTGLPYTKANIKYLKSKLEEYYYQEIKSDDISKRTFQAKKDFAKYCFEIKDLSEATMNDYINTLNRIIQTNYEIDKKEKGQYKLITDLEKFLFKNKHLKPQTLNNKIRNYQVFLNYLDKMNYLNKSIKVSHYKMRAKQKEVMIYSDDEINQILEYFDQKDLRMSFFIKIQLLTGMRRGEVLSLKWNMIDFEKQNITIPNKINKLETQTIPFTSEVMEILNSLKQYSHNERVFSFWSVKNNSRLNTRLIVAQKKLGIHKEGRSFHSFRKTFATKLISNNLALNDVKDLMRHSNIDVTLKHYNKSDLLKLKSVLEELI
jgi:integrase